MKGLKFECLIWYFMFKRIRMEPNEFKVFRQWVWVHLHVFILYEMQCFLRNALCQNLWGSQSVYVSTLFQGKKRREPGEENVTLQL